MRHIKLLGFLIVVVEGLTDPPFDAIIDFSLSKPRHIDPNFDATYAAVSQYFEKDMGTEDCIISRANRYTTGTTFNPATDTNTNDPDWVTDGVGSALDGFYQANTKNNKYSPVHKGLYQDYLRLSRRLKWLNHGNVIWFAVGLNLDESSTGREATAGSLFEAHWYRDLSLKVKDERDRKKVNHCWNTRPHDAATLADANDAALVTDPTVRNHPEMGGGWEVLHYEKNTPRCIETITNFEKETGGADDDNAELNWKSELNHKWFIRNDLVATGPVGDTLSNRDTKCNAPPCAKSPISNFLRGPNIKLYSLACDKNLFLRAHWVPMINSSGACGTDLSPYPPDPTAPTGCMFAASGSYLVPVSGSTFQTPETAFPADDETFQTWAGSERTGIASTWPGSLEPGSYKGTQPSCVGQVDSCQVCLPTIQADYVKQSGGCHTGADQNDQPDDQASFDALQKVTTKATWANGGGKSDVKFDDDGNVVSNAEGTAGLSFVEAKVNTSVAQIDSVESSDSSAATLSGWKAGDPPVTGSSTTHNVNGQHSFLKLPGGMKACQSTNPKPVPEGCGMPQTVEVKVYETSENNYLDLGTDIATGKADVSRFATEKGGTGNSGFVTGSNDMDLKITDQADQTAGATVGAVETTKNKEDATPA